MMNVSIQDLTLVWFCLFTMVEIFNLQEYLRYCAENLRVTVSQPPPVRQEHGECVNARFARHFS